MEEKFCVGCRHMEAEMDYIAGYIEGEPIGHVLARWCRRSTHTLSRDLVTGYPMHHKSACSHERVSDSPYDCGPEGKFWEAK